jgi:hypothetical protein
MRSSLLGIAAATLALVAACSNSPEPTGAPPAPAAPGTTAVAEASSAAPAEPVDAAAVIEQLKAADLGLTKSAVQNEDTDPNNLLGRPNGYTSRASADLPGGDTTADPYTVDRGLVAEGFPDADSVKRRSDYIQALQKDTPLLGTEWHYTTGNVLIRVSGKVKPSLAKKIEAALS